MYLGVCKTAKACVLIQRGPRFHQTHRGVIKWKHFPCYWPFVWRIHRSPVNSPHKGQWRGALMFSLICTWTNGWVNNRYAGDLRRHRTHYDVTVMESTWEYFPHHCSARDVSVVRPATSSDAILWNFRCVPKQSVDQLIVFWSIEMIRYYQTLSVKMLLSSPADMRRNDNVKTSKRRCNIIASCVRWEQENHWVKGPMLL